MRWKVRTFQPSFVRSVLVTSPSDPTRNSTPCSTNQLLIPSVKRWSPPLNPQTLDSSIVLMSSFPPFVPANLALTSSISAASLFTSARYELSLAHPSFRHSPPRSIPTITLLHSLSASHSMGNTARTLRRRVSPEKMPWMTALMMLAARGLPNLREKKASIDSSPPPGALWRGDRRRKGSRKMPGRAVMMIGLVTAATMAVGREEGRRVREEGQ